MSDVQRRRSSGYLEKEWADIDVSTFLPNEDFPERYRERKMKTVHEAIEACDLGRIAELARSSEGLVASDLRVKAWPLLLNVFTANSNSKQKVDSIGASADALDFHDLEPHKDEGQVLLDIKRLFTVMLHFISFSHAVSSSYTTILSKDDIEEMRKRLFCLIVRVLRKYPCLNYYQGYHDIATVILLVCNDSAAGNDDLAAMLLEKLTVEHLRDYMISDIGLSVNHLKIIPCIIEREDTLLFQLIRQTSNSHLATNGFYFDYEFLQALLSILTIFSHDVTNFSHLLMIWDFVFSYRSVAVSAFIYAAITLHFKDVLLEELCVSSIEDLASVDPDCVHSLLSPTSLFSRITDSNLGDILSFTKQLIDEHLLTGISTPDTIGVWFGEFNKHSVLCTSSKLGTIFSSEYDMGDERVASIEPGHLDNNEDLSPIITLQEHEQEQETAHKASLMTMALEQDSLATSITSLDNENEFSSGNLLSSSISSISGAPSALKREIIQTSSMILKNLLPQHRPDDAADPRDSRRRNSLIVGSIYKVSLTVGFCGFLLHFLLKESHWYKSSMSHLATRTFSTFGADLAMLKRDVGHGISRVVGNVFSFLDDTSIFHSGLDITQVGLGTLRDSVYAFGN